MTKARLTTLEFYITNVCNYNCENCNRLNNFYFSGHQYWKDYESIHKEWALKLDIDQIVILGGEPLLNPSLPDWLNGLRGLWPDSKITLLTNGTRLEFWPDLYNTILKNNILLHVQLHNRDRYNTYISYLEEFFYKNVSLKYDYGSQHLQNWVESYNLVKDPQWPDCQSINDFKNLPGIIKKECTEIHKIDTDNFIKNTGGVLITDENNVGVNVEYAEHFWTGPLKYSGNNQFDVYNSNPTTAHNTCHSKFCYNLIKGKLYKCHHVALLPEFMEQFHVNMTSKDIDLLTSYKALEATQPIDEILQFIENLPKEIPQCKFCPESLDTVLLKSSTKKIKILKRSKIP